MMFQRDRKSWLPSMTERFGSRSKRRKNQRVRSHTVEMLEARQRILVSGRSRNTQVGGVIPLGNVTSGNAWNGIEVRDRATGFVSFNTFAGIAAFGDAVPNGRNGMLVTSVGGDNLIRTSIVGGNLRHGIEIGGRATGVQVTDTDLPGSLMLQWRGPT